MIEMTKKKPDGKTLINYRIELQDKERELLEQAIIGQQFTTVVDSIVKGISSMDIMTMYGLLTIAEGMGWIDTPIPTITDLMTSPEDSAKAAAGGAIKQWSENRKQARDDAYKQRQEEGSSRPAFVEQSDAFLYEAYDTFWVTKLIGMILDPTGKGKQN